MPEFFRQFGELMYAAVGFYAMLLIRCAIISIPVVAFILAIRKLFLKNMPFAKCLIWLFIVPVPFLGRLHIFYETKLLAKIFVNLQGMCFEYIWISYIYVAIICILLCVSTIRSHRLSKYIHSLKQMSINGTDIFVNNLYMTPFVVGMFRPKIVIPEYLTAPDMENDLSTILLHEKSHIRQGHLVFMALWNILRILLWINPLMFFSTKILKYDFETACDVSVIQKKGGSPVEYGQMLLDNLKIINRFNTASNTLTLFGGTAFRSMKKRIESITRFKPYNTKRIRIMAAVSLLILVCFFILIKTISFRRINEMNNIAIYNATDMETVIQYDNTELSSTSYYDDKYLYINADLLDNLIDLEKYGNKELWIYFGGFYKLPGIGGGGEVAVINGRDIGTGMVKIPYEEAQDTLVITLLKLM